MVNTFDFKSTLHRQFAAPRLLLALLLLLPVTVLVYQATTRSVVVDEIGHLPAIVSQSKFLRFDLYRVNPPLSRWLMSIACSKNISLFNWSHYSDEVGKRPEFRIGLDAFRSNRLDFSRAVIPPRLINVAVFCFGAIVFYVFVRSALGAKPAFIACLFFLCCPNHIAFASTLCPDTSASVAFVASAFASWRYVKSRTAFNACIAGLVIGLGLATKLSLISTIFTMPMIAIVAMFCSSKKPSSASLFHLILFFFIALFTLNSVYLFEGALVPIRNFEFCSTALGGHVNETGRMITGNAFRSSLLGYLPSPLPANYLLGIDFLRFEVERKYWSFLAGEWRFGSWPYYYVFTTLLKTPEATLIASLVGLTAFSRDVFRGNVRFDVIVFVLFLLIPSSVCFATISLQGGFNHHHRYVLMIYPALYVLCVYTMSRTDESRFRICHPVLDLNRRNLSFIFVSLLLFFSCLSTYRVHPYYTSYFNSISGGPENGWKLLGFSNIDWGQDLRDLEEWINRNPHRTPHIVDIDFFQFGGELLGVPSTRAPELSKGQSIDFVRSTIRETQWWIVSVKKLYNLPGHPGLEYLQQIEPVEKIAFSYHVYRIDPLPATPLSN